MTEEKALDVEVLPPANQLQIIVKESGLPTHDALFLLGKFEDDFKNVAEWAKKASKIIVTDASQTVIMEQARTGRLFLAKIRIEVEKNRKALKEDSLKRGKAIDKVAGFITDLITPSEKHLERQEKFLEFRKKAEDDRILVEARAKMEAEALIEQNRLAEETKKIREENEILRKEKQEQMKKDADKIREKEKLLSGDDTDMLIILRKQLTDIKIPQFRSQKNKRIAEDIKGYLYNAIRLIKLEEEE